MPAERLDRTPDIPEEEPSEAPGELSSLVTRLAKAGKESPASKPVAKPKATPRDEDVDQPAGREEYERLMADQPEKLTAAQAHYEEAPEGQHERCKNCVHSYTRNVNKVHVCELVRPDEDEINPEWYCHLWNDGKSDELPFLKEEKPKQ